MNYKQIFLQALMIFCEERQLDTAHLAKLSGFTLDDLFNTKDFSLSNREMEVLWKNIVRLSRNEMIGFHFGATMQVAALSVVGQVILTSANVKEALHNASALMHLFTDLYTMEIEEKGKTFIIRFNRNERYQDLTTSFQQMGDFLITFTLHELKGLLLKQAHPLHAYMPGYHADHESLYARILNCAVRKKDHYLLEFDKAHLYTPIITANYELQKILLMQLHDLRGTFVEKGALSTAIYNYLISNSYLYSLSIEAVADNFNISVRTLQRKLKEEKMSYLEIVDEVRKALAMQYLRSNHASVKEIADTLGYAEVSGFIRAFKRWTGSSPAAFRK